MDLLGLKLEQRQQQVFANNESVQKCIDGHLAPSSGHTIELVFSTSKLYLHYLFMELFVWCIRAVKKWKIWGRVKPNGKVI